MTQASSRPNFNAAQISQATADTQDENAGFTGAIYALETGVAARSPHMIPYDFRITGFALAASADPQGAITGRPSINGQPQADYTIVLAPGLQLDIELPVVLAEGVAGDEIDLSLGSADDTVIALAFIERIS